MVAALSLTFLLQRVFFMSEAGIAIELQPEEALQDVSTFEIPEIPSPVEELKPHEDHDKEVKDILESLQKPEKPQASSGEDIIGEIIASAEQSLKDQLGYSHLEVISSWQQSAIVEAADGNTYFQDSKDERTTFQDTTGNEFNFEKVAIEQDFRGKEYGGSIKIHIGTYIDADGSRVHLFIEQTYRAPESYADTDYDTDTLVPTLKDVVTGVAGTVQIDVETRVSIHTQENIKQEAFVQQQNVVQNPTEKTNNLNSLFEMKSEAIRVTEEIVQEKQIATEASSFVERQSPAAEESITEKVAEQAKVKEITSQEQIKETITTTETLEKGDKAPLSDIETRQSVQTKEIINQEKVSQAPLPAKKPESRIVVTSDEATMKALETHLSFQGEAEVLTSTIETAKTHITIKWGNQNLFELLSPPLAEKVSATIEQAHQSQETRLLIAEVPTAQEKSDGVLIVEKNHLESVTVAFHVAPEQIVKVDSLAKAPAEVVREEAATTTSEKQTTATQVIETSQVARQEAVQETTISQVGDLTTTQEKIEGTQENIEMNNLTNEIQKQTAEVIEAATEVGSLRQPEEEQSVENPSREFLPTPELERTPIVETARPLIIPLFSNVQPSPVGSSQTTTADDSYARSTVSANRTVAQAA